MENIEIRTYAKTHGVKLWEVAEALGVVDSTLSRKLRRELPEDQRNHVMSAIDRVVQNRSGSMN